MNSDDEFNRCNMDYMYKLSGEVNDMIVSVVNNKGGVGKTTCTTVLAQTALQKGLKRILVVDTCGQQNALDNLTIDGMPVFKGIDILPSPVKTPDQKFLRTFDLSIIDTPPNTESTVVRKVIQYADFVVAPFMLEKHSLAGIDEIFALVPLQKLIPLCILPRVQYSYTKLLLDEAKKKLGKNFLSWPNYSRIERNIGNKDDFFKGLTDEEMQKFMNLIDMIFQKEK